MTQVVNINLDNVQPLNSLLTALSALSFAGNGDKYLKVTTGADGFEFATVSGGGGVWGSITGTLSDQTDLQTALNLKANVADPTFTTKITTPIVRASDSSGLIFQSNNGTQVADFGAGGGSNATFAGGVTVAGQLAVDTNTLFVDAVNNRVGIGTSTPAHQYEQYLAGQTGVSNIGFKYSVQNTTFSKVLGFQHHAYYGSSILAVFDGLNGEFQMINTGDRGAFRTSNIGSITMGTPSFYLSDVNYAIANAYLFGSASNKSISIGSNSATTANLNVHCTGTSKIGAIIQAAAGQTADLFQLRSSAAAVLTHYTNNGAWSPASLADADAANGTVYYSTTASKLVYKDSSGTVNNLY